MDTSFLMEIMEINENLMEINDPESISKVSEQNSQMITSLIK